MDTISSFSISVDNRGSFIPLSLEGEGVCAVPVKHKKSHPLTHTLVAPDRDIGVIKKAIHGHGEVNKMDECRWQDDCFHLSPCSDPDEALGIWRFNSIRLLILDPFSLSFNLVKKLESEMRELRSVLAFDGIPSTFSYATSTNSSNWSAYKNEAMQLFDYKLFPLSMSSIKSFDVILTISDLMEKKDDGAIFSNIKSSRELFMRSRK